MRDDHSEVACATFTYLFVKEVISMSRLELLMVLYSLKAFLDKGMVDDAMELINKVIYEAEKTPK